MKKLIVLCGYSCGYCKKAKMLINRAIYKDKKLSAVDICYVYEDEADTLSLKHTLLPAFFIDGNIKFEGNPDIGTVNAILQLCFRE